MKTIIAGGRDFEDWDYLFDCLAAHGEITEVVSGAAKGADSLGEEWADTCAIPVEQFPAKWNEFGKRAGFLRNTQMGDYADQLIAFWDGESRGTKHMIDYMESLGKPVYIYKY